MLEKVHKTKYKITLKHTSQLKHKPCETNINKNPTRLANIIEKFNGQIEAAIKIKECNIK